MKQKENNKIAFKTGKAERYSYGLYFFGQLIFYTIVMGYLQLYMTEAGIPAAWVGGIFIVAKIWDAINDPLFGIVVDKAKLKKGKYIPWIRLSSFMIPAATIFMFAMPMGVSVQIKAIWATAAYVLWDTSYTICDVPIFALATSMTDDLKERDWLYILNRFFMFVGSLAVTIVLPMLYPNIGWTAAVIIMSVLAMATMLPIGYKAKERYFVKEENEKEPSIKELFHYLGRNKYLLIFSGALILGSLTSTVGTVGNYVAIHCLGGPEWISVIGLVSALPMLVAIVIVQKLLKKIDKFRIYMGCNVAMLVVSIAMYFAGYSNTTLFLLLVALRAMFASASEMLVVMFTADCAEYGHFVTGERAQGMAFSVQTFTAKIKGALASAIGMFMLGAVGFVEGTGAIQSAHTISWLWKMYTVVPLITGVLAFLIVLTCYKLNSKDVALMMRANAGEISKEEAVAGFTREYR